MTLSKAAAVTMLLIGGTGADSLDGGSDRDKVATGTPAAP